MDTFLIDIVLDQWRKQDDSGVKRWAFFLCSKNKTPYYPKGHKFGNGHNSSTSDEITAREMFGTATTKGNFIGVAGGELSGGVFVVDIDIKKEGIPELYKNPDNIESSIVNMFGDLPKTESQTTMSGGRHLLFYDNKINSLNDAFDFKTTGLSIDIKGNGGYFILYDDDINFENISDSPSWLLDYMYSRKTDQKKTTADFAETLVEGNRNSGLTAIAGKFYNYGDSIDILKSFLHGHNKLHCAPPLPDKDVDRIIKSVIDNFSRDYEKTKFDDIPDGDYDFNCLADFCVEVEDELFLVQDMITEGSLTIFTGTSGSGKTWVTTDLCLSVAQGIEWLGKKTIQKNVLIVDEESGEKRLIRRMRKLAAGRGMMDIGKNKSMPHDSEFGKLNIKGRSFRRTDISTRSFLTKYKEIIIRDNIGIILFDALVDITPGKNENDSKEMLPALLNLKQLCEETGVTIIVIHHAGKSEASNSRGTSAIEGAVDAMFKITQKEETGILIIESKKERDIKKIKIGADLKFSDYTVNLETCDMGKEAKLGKEFSNLKIKILKFLNISKEWMRIRTICINIQEFTETNIKKQLKELSELGYLEKKLIDGTDKNGNIWRISIDKYEDIENIIENGYLKKYE